MADTIVDVVSKSDFLAAQKEISELRAANAALQEGKVKEQVTALEKTIASKDEEIKNVNIELDNVKASKKDVEDKLTASKAEVETITKKLVEAQAFVDETKKAVAKATRLSTLVEKGVDKVEAEKLVDSYASASDELFAVLVETQAKLVEAQKASAAFDLEKKKKEDKEKEKKKAEADEKKLGETSSTEAALSVETEPETDSVIAGLADFLSQEVGKSVNKRNSK